MFFRYQLCSEGNFKIDGECIPPSQDASKYLKRVNYHFVFWKRSLEQDPVTQSLVGLGWDRETDRNLKIRWTSLKAVPVEILQLLSSDINVCIYLTNTLNCTDAPHSLFQYFVCDDTESIVVSDDKYAKRTLNIENIK